MSHALQPFIDRHSAGERWIDIAKSLSIPESTLRTRLRAAGLLQYKTGKPRPTIAKVKSQPSQPATAPAALEQAAPAPAQQSNFVLPEWYALLRYAMQSEKGACLFGPRGCGKSTAIRHLADDMAKPTITLQCAANMQIDSLLGTWTAEKGSTTYVEGPLTQAVRSGAWLLAEEANVIHPGVWSCVNTLTDATGEPLRLPTGETIAQHPDFRLILIYNEGYTGTRDVNAALKDRLMPIYTGYLASADESRLLHCLTGAPADQCDKVQSVASMIRAANLRFDLSPRSLVRWIKLVKHAGLTWSRAYQLAIVDLAGPADLAAPQRACLMEIAANSVDQWDAAPASDASNTSNSESEK